MNTIKDVKIIKNISHFGAPLKGAIAGSAPSSAQAKKQIF